MPSAMMSVAVAKSWLPDAPPAPPVPELELVDVDVEVLVEVDVVELDEVDVVVVVVPAGSLLQAAAKTKPSANVPKMSFDFIDASGPKDQSRVRLKRPTRRKKGRGTKVVVPRAGEETKVSRGA
jgi:hypothetical protein